jgi:hypothetical protein
MPKRFALIFIPVKRQKQENFKIEDSQNNIKFSKRFYSDKIPKK